MIIAWKLIFLAKRKETRSTCKERGSGATRPDPGRREGACDEEEKGSTQGIVEAVRVLETALPSVGI